MNIKLVVGIALIALVVVFTLQNTQTVEITLLLWTVSMSRAVMIFLVFLLGLVSGWILHSYIKRRRGRH